MGGWVWIGGVSISVLWVWVCAAGVDRCCVH